MNKPKFHSFFELASESSGHFTIEHAQRGSELIILTPHGGGIEPGTSEVVKALAGQHISYYCFEGIRQDGNDALHITSTRFDEPVGRSMAANAETVLAVHGCGDKKERLYLGGLNEEWIAHFLSAFQEAGFPAERGFGHISGKSPRNICNLGRKRKGIQFELSEGLRRKMFLGLDHQGRQHQTALFDQFVEVGKTVINSSIPALDL